MRARKVTRTIKATEVTLMAVEVLTAEVQNVPIKLSHEFKTGDDIMKYINKHPELLPDGVKAVAVVDFMVTEQLYGMDEQKFIEQAEILPSRNQ